MTNLVAGILESGIPVTGMQRFALMLPLCLAIAVIYKATRCERMRDVPASAFILWITIVVGMYGVGIGLYVLYKVMV
jgi:hypothetical protein